ncbi:dihydroneopterin aldolase [Candidatus Saccharibacteria bacterium]|jgi:FolB domain-containing protein|nr:dihydroneopterin aldolase [Candidatus Saccharibacteria bacterium]MBP9131576.1 dihydroneopterin aldolase [Candidatus Saccharibacteria bacterium]
MNTTVRINNLRISTIIGVNPWERENEQEIIINVSFKYDAQQAVINDDIKAAIDYSVLQKKITEKLKSSNFQLIEALAEMILKFILEDKLIDEAQVRIDKPNGIKSADSVSVELKGSNA